MLFFRKYLRKKVLEESLNFSLPPKNLGYAKYMANFELFYRSIHNLGILFNEDLEFLKLRTIEVASSSHNFLFSSQNYNTIYGNIFLKKNFCFTKSLQK